MHEKNKWIFWAFVLASLTIICVPSTYLISTLQSYVSFLQGFEPGALHPIRLHLIPHGPRARPEREKPIRFISFKLKAPGAKKVALIGDFDAWKADALPLWRQGRGVWEIILPLPPGDYRYLFLVDGSQVLDPQNKSSETLDGRKVSVRTIH